MKTSLVLSSLFFAQAAILHAAISQTFETGEDTSNWGSGSTWSGLGITASTFLDSSIGGSSSGFGDHNVQNYSRSFQNNTEGLVVSTDTYEMSMYLIFDQFDVSSGSGKFEVFDGDYGSSTANLKVDSTAGMEWQVNDGGSWVNLGLTAQVGSIYHISYIVDPTGGTYSASVAEVDTFGVVQGSSVSTSGVDFQSSNAVGNNQSGKLGFHIDVSSATVDFRVDNINIDAIPEPSTTAFGMSALLVGLLRRRR
ncbi:hypothetical protein ACFPK9_12470 [Rubritalea spongiae]|uniref:PEP-CTERM sorting domain-containing protein n=1 Tax=Rubritalea spongiae TaxID=430797 RepID=A0ABW5E8U7_9BACT